MPGNLSLMEKLRLLQEWAPLLGFGQRYVAETDPRKRLLVIGDAAEWLTSKTANTLDDKIVEKLVAVLKTAEGADLVGVLVGLWENCVAAAGEVQP